MIGSLGIISKPDAHLQKTPDYPLDSTIVANHRGSFCLSALIPPSGNVADFNEIAALVKSQLSHSKSLKQQSTQRRGQWAMFSTSSCRGVGEDNPH